MGAASSLTRGLQSQKRSKVLVTAAGKAPAAAALALALPSSEQGKCQHATTPRRLPAVCCCLSSRRDPWPPLGAPRQQRPSCQDRAGVSTPWSRAPPGCPPPQLIFAFLPQSYQHRFEPTAGLRCSQLPTRPKRFWPQDAGRSQAVALLATKCTCGVRSTPACGRLRAELFASSCREVRTRARLHTREQGGSLLQPSPAGTGPPARLQRPGRS